jgi:predicted Fe-Mo cluster-binding NifX family protein
MIIAITSTGNTFDSKVSDKFGRCRYFTIINPDTMQFEAIKNPAEQLQGGAGPKAAETIINKGVNVLLTGHVGDKAEDALKRGNIKIYDYLTENLSVKEALNNYLSKQKQEM